MISLLVALIVFCLIVGVVIWLIRMLPIPAPFGNIVVVAVVLIALLVFLDRFGGMVGLRL